MSQRYAIAQVTPHPWEDAHEVNAYVGSLASELAERGHRVLIVAPSRSPELVRESRRRIRSREVFSPIDPDHVRLYVCGPTVYDLAHVGNARPVVVYDVLARLLRLLYPRVTYVRNITDVDDKINARATRDHLTIAEVTSRTAADFHADMAALGALPGILEHLRGLSAGAGDGR